LQNLEDAIKESMIEVTNESCQLLAALNAADEPNHKTE
jgi:hypothetical protein